MKMSRKENCFKPSPFGHQGLNLRTQGRGLGAISLNSSLNISEKLIPIQGGHLRLV